MTPEEIEKANLIKIGFQCPKCSLIYEIDHPRGEEDKCIRKEAWGGPSYRESIRLTLRNWNLYKIQGAWYRVAPSLADIFIRFTLIEDAVMGYISYPLPTNITRQVDIFTLAEKLGIPPPLNDYQKKRAKSKAFIERIKKS